MNLPTALTIALGGLAVSASPSRRILPSAASPYPERMRFWMQQHSGRVDQGEAAFQLKEAKRQPNGFAPTKRRLAGIGGGGPPHLRNRCDVALFRLLNRSVLRSVLGQR